MRKRYGAIHSDTTEDYIQLAIVAENKDGVFYEEILDGKQKVDRKKQCIRLFKEFTFSTDEFDKIPTRDNSDDDLAHLREEITREVKTIFFAYNGISNYPYIQRFLQLPSDEPKEFEYTLRELNEEKSIRYWVRNLNFDNHEQILSVYKKTCSVLVFLDESNNSQQLQEILNGVDTKSTQIYHICQLQQEFQLDNDARKYSSDELLGLKLNFRNNLINRKPFIFLMIYKTKLLFQSKNIQHSSQF